MDLMPEYEAQLTAEERARQAALKKKAEARRAAIRAEHPASWHPDENTLFERMQMRGYEPLMDYSWALVFRTCPAELFSLDEGECFLNSLCGNDFQGTSVRPCGPSPCWPVTLTASHHGAAGAHQSGRPGARPARHRPPHGARPEARPRRVHPLGRA
jgi:hypothetical protein